MFIDLRDREGVCQVVIDPDTPAAFAAAERSRSEYVLRATGKVRLRPEGTVNAERRTGKIEVLVKHLEILNEARTPPFQIDEKNVSDDTRLRYRYIDLRTERMRENLRLPPVVAQGGMSEDELYALFPNLAERARSAGTHLSGGEQQMLAIARILRTGARVLLLDEPTEGLAPVIVDRIGELIRQLKSRGYTILLVEQNVHFAAELADRHCLMESGRVTDTFDAATLLRDFDAITARIGV